MKYIEVLQTFHEGFKPTSYLEIGVRNGNSLRLSRVKSIGIDPAFAITQELRTRVNLYRTTSDDFFAKRNPDRILNLKGAGVDMIFIDGMHLAEYVLRDLVNSMRAASARGVIIFDDIIPYDMDITSRVQPPKGGWTGDVYKVPVLLKRAGAEFITVDTRPTGLCIMECTPHNRAIVEKIADTPEERLIDDTYALKSVEEIREVLGTMPAQDYIENHFPRLAATAAAA